MLSLFRMGVQPADRLIQVDRIANRLRQPGGATMNQLLELTSERREVISNDLESMRDDLGFPIHWDPDTGTYRLGENPKAWQPRPGGRNLVLLFRAIRLEEYLYVSFTTESGRQTRIHALPRKVKKVGGRRQVILRERSGECCLVDLAMIREVAEAFGMNR